MPNEICNKKHLSLKKRKKAYIILLVPNKKMIAHIYQLFMP